MLILKRNYEKLNGNTQYIKIDGRASFLFEIRNVHPYKFVINVHFENGIIAIRVYKCTFKSFFGRLIYNPRSIHFPPTRLK